MFEKVNNSSLGRRHDQSNPRSLLELFVFFGFPGELFSDTGIEKASNLGENTGSASRCTEPTRCNVLISEQVLPLLHRVAVAAAFPVSGLTC